MKVFVLAATAVIGVAGMGFAPDLAAHLQTSPRETSLIVDDALGARSPASAATAIWPVGDGHGIRLAGTFVGNPD